MLAMSPRLRRVEQVERNREVVMEAARRVFLHKGYAGATLEAICEEAGFSKGVVYSQFGSKADLFFALLELRIDERARHNDRIAANLSGAQGVAEMIRIASRNATVEREWTQLLVEFRALAVRDAALNQRYAEAHARTVRHLASALTRLHDRSSIEPSVPLRAMAEFILAIDSGITLERAADPGALDEGYLTVMIPRALGLQHDKAAQSSRRIARRRPKKRSAGTRKSR